jgi:hypothetical protein
MNSNSKVGEVGFGAKEQYDDRTVLRKNSIISGVSQAVIICTKKNCSIYARARLGDSRLDKLLLGPAPEPVALRG